MRRLMLLVVLMTGCFFCEAQQHNAVALKIAQKMKDSLSLTPIQKDQVYSINLQLHEQKMEARLQGGNISTPIQRIENTRDSLYRPILNEQQFQLYRTKKKNLVSNN